MKSGDVPTVADLKDAALSDSSVTVMQLALSDVIMVQVLASVGQAVVDLRAQVEKLQVAPRDAASEAILKAHEAAENLLQLCAEAAHLSVKCIMEHRARQSAAWFN